MFEIFLFGVEDCPDCIEQKRILDEYFPKYQFVNIESDSLEDLQIISKFEVDDIPTVIVALESKGKQRTFRHCGIIAPGKLQKFLDKFI